MAIGKSKRIVIDVDDVDLKRRLYAALLRDGLSLKDWFISSANRYLSATDDGRQIDLPIVAEAQPPYGRIRK